MQTIERCHTPRCFGGKQTGARDWPEMPSHRRRAPSTRLKKERGGRWPSCLKSMRCSRRQTGAPNSGVAQSATLGGLVFCDWFSAAMLVFCPGEPRPPSAHRRPPRNRGDLRRRPLSGAGAPWYATRIQRPGMARMDVEPLLRWSDLKLGAKKQFPERPNHGPSLHRPSDAQPAEARALASGGDAVNGFERFTKTEDMQAEAFRHQRRPPSASHRRQ